MFYKQLINHKSSLFSVSKEEFLNLGFHYGHLKRRFLFLTSPFVLGVRNNLIIFNLDYTTLSFRRVLKFVNNLTQRRSKILFLSVINDNSLKPLLSFLIGNLRQAFYQGSYLGGFLSNFNMIKKGLINNKKGSIFRFGSVLKDVLPSAVCIGHSNDFFYVYKEAVSVGIPSIGLVDSDLDFRDVMYPIMSNNENQILIYFFFFNIINQIKITNLILKKEYIDSKILTFKNYVKNYVLYRYLSLNDVYFRNTPYIAMLMFRCRLMSFVFFLNSVLRPFNSFLFPQSYLENIIKTFSYLREMDLVKFFRKSRVRNVFLSILLSKPLYRTEKLSSLVMALKEKHPSLHISSMTHFQIEMHIYFRYASHYFFGRFNSVSFYFSRLVNLFYKYLLIIFSLLKFSAFGLDVNHIIFMLVHRLFKIFYKFLEIGLSFQVIFFFYYLYIYELGFARHTKKITRSFATTDSNGEDYEFNYWVFVVLFSWLFSRVNLVFNLYYYMFLSSKGLNLKVLDKLVFEEFIYEEVEKKEDEEENKDNEGNNEQVVDSHSEDDIGKIKI
jgi:small subunit ribosomal protein S2